MKHRIFLALAAMLGVTALTGCGGRMEDTRVPEATVIPTERATTREETTVRGTETSHRGGKTVREAKDMADDAAEDVSEAVSDVVQHGKNLATGVATDVSDAVADRRNDGDYRTDDDGRVQERPQN